MSTKAIDGIDVVIVDVLRATTTIVFAVSRGASVLSLADEHEARARGEALGDRAILVGEHMGKRLPGFHCNNSQAELAALELADKTVVITTTNGTKAVAACSSAHRVFAGALTNAPALGAYLCASGELERDLAIICAGRSTGALAYEDVLGAGAVTAAVLGATRAGADLWLADGARLAHEVFLRHREDLAAAVAGTDAAQELIDEGCGTDVTIAGTHGSNVAVPLLQGGMFVDAAS